jgi:lipoprotein NlpI
MRTAMLGLLLLSQEMDETVRSGLQKLERGEIESALKIFETALGEHPKNAAARVGRARVWMHLKRLPEEILEEFARALRDDPRQVDAHLNRGIVLNGLNRFEEALKDFDRAVEIGGRGIGISWAMRGSCLSKLNRFEEAARDLDQAVGAGYRTPQTYFWRAKARYMILDTGGSIVDTSRMLDLDPADLACLNMRWVAYFQIGAWDNALRDLRAYIKASKNISEGVAIWMYMAHRRAGKKDARDMLHAQWESRNRAAPGSWPVAELFLGLRKEADVLVDAKGDPIFEVFAAYARWLEGDEDGALKLFEGAVRTLDQGRTEAADARAAIRRIKRGKKQARLEDLEGKLRVLKPFEARFEGENVVLSGGQIIEAIDLRVDYAGRRTLFALTSRRDEKIGRTFLYGEGMKLALWGFSEYQGTVDMTSLFSGFEELVEGMARSLDKIASPTGPVKREERPVGHRLNLLLMGASKSGEGANVKFASGIGTRPANWLSEALEDDDLSLREEGDEVVLEIPKERKRIRVDRDTGFPRLLESRDAEGEGVHRLRRASFKYIDVWPDPRVPADLKPMPLDPKELSRQLETQDFSLVLYLREAMDRWDAIPGADEAQVEASVVRWAARYADTVYAQAVRHAARTLIQEALGNGANVADLLKDADGNAQRFAARVSGNLGGLDAHLQEALARLGDRVESGVIGSWVDSEKHPVLKKLLRRALNPQRVGAARKAAYGDRLEKLYLEELATFRQL